MEAQSPVSLRGKVVALAGGERGDPPLGRHIADALTAAGAAVSMLDIDASDEPLDGLVYAAVDAVALEPMPFTDVDDARWDAVWEGTMGETIAFLQGAWTRLHERGGSIVVVVPTLAFGGAAGLVGYAAAIEGQRALAKSVARQWGADGVRVNCLAVAPEHVLGATIAADADSLTPPAFAATGDVIADLAPIVAYLLSDAAHFVTGATICADGGVWMP